MSCVHVAEDIKNPDKQDHIDPVYRCNFTGELCIYQFPNDIYCRVLREKEQCDK